MLPPTDWVAVTLHEIGHGAPLILLPGGEKRFGIARDQAEGWRCVSHVPDHCDERTALASSYGGPLMELYAAKGFQMSPTLSLIEAEGVGAFRWPHIRYGAADAEHVLFDEALIPRATIVSICRWCLPRFAAVIRATGEPAIAKIARHVEDLRTGQMVIVEAHGLAIRYAGLGMAPPEHAG